MEYELVMKPNVYLDIDGVLLANDLNPALHVHDFLVKVKENANDVYWLTTHCKGDATTAYKRLELVLEPNTMDLLTDVKATDWDAAKTDAKSIINLWDYYLSYSVRTTKKNQKLQ
jgi:hypothetical protein